MLNDPRPVIMHHEWGNQLHGVLWVIVVALSVVFVLDLIWIYWKGIRQTKKGGK